MFGYAVDETENLMPLTLDLAHLLLRELSDIRREGKEMVYYRKGKLKTYLRPDSKSQVTVEYNDDRTPKRIHTIVVSTQHDDFITPLDDSDQARDRADEEMLEKIRKDVKEVLLPRVIAKLPENVKALFRRRHRAPRQPDLSKFVLGGPHADTEA